MTIRVAKGEKITCEKGHVICTAATDIESSSPLSVDQFHNWRIPVPQRGETVKSCPKCGGVYIESLGDGLRVHVKGRGWDDPLSARKVAQCLS